MRRRDHLSKKGRDVFPALFTTKEIRSSAVTVSDSRNLLKSAQVFTAECFNKFLKMRLNNRNGT
jgi:hypothetical protein